jgi:hypothetical protein
MKYLYLNYCDGKIDCKNEREKNLRVYRWANNWVPCFVGPFYLRKLSNAHMGRTVARSVRVSSHVGS